MPGMGQAQDLIFAKYEHEGCHMGLYNALSITALRAGYDLRPRTQMIKKAMSCIALI